MSLALNTKHLSSFINEEEYKAIYPQVEAAHKTLEAKNGPGSDFLGWMYLPRDYDKEEFERIKAAAAKIREDSDVLVVAGIGGSYLGARAVIEAVKGMYHNELDNGLKIYFCGNSISPTYLNDIITLCKGKRFSINVISKSGTTTETSLAFRVLRKLLEDEMGVEEANKRGALPAAARAHAAAVLWQHCGRCVPGSHDLLYHHGNLLPVFGAVQRGRGHLPLRRQQRGIHAGIRYHEHYQYCGQCVLHLCAAHGGCRCCQQI